MENGEYDYKKLKEAGKVSQDALEYAKTLIKPGKKLLDVAESIEYSSRIRDVSVISSKSLNKR